MLGAQLPPGNTLRAPLAARVFPWDAAVILSLQTPPVTASPHVSSRNQKRLSLNYREMVLAGGCLPVAECLALESGPKWGFAPRGSAGTLLGFQPSAHAVCFMPGDAGQTSETRQ